MSETPLSAHTLKPRVVEVCRIAGFGFEVYTQGNEGRVPRFFSLYAEQANAEAQALHELDCAFHAQGIANGIDRPDPVLKLWEGDHATAT